MLTEPNKMDRVIHESVAWGNWMFSQGMPDGVSCDVVDDRGD